MKRVIYQKNPIVEAIIQIRFPKILALNSEDPIAFQEEIKHDFPIYQLGLETQQEISIKAPNTLPSIIQKEPIKNHCFISSNGEYKINLTSSFISISTIKYTRWEDMMDKLKKPLDAFLNIYQPPFASRIGLRYIDVFSRSKLNLEGTPWSSLIASPLSGAFINHCESSLISSSIDYESLLDDSVSRSKIHAGLGNLDGSAEKVFVIDGDFVRTSPTPITELSNVLNYLHTKEKEFIHNSITETLHLAMKPETVI